MTKAELIRRVSADFPGLTPREIDLVVSTVVDEIAAALARGQRVSLRGFGSFRTKHLGYRASRNPRTGRPVEAMPKAIPAFKAGRTLLAAVNGRV